MSGQPSHGNGQRRSHIQIGRVRGSQSIVESADPHPGASRYTSPRIKTGPLRPGQPALPGKVARTTQVRMRPAGN